MPPEGPEFRIDVPSELEVGVFSNFMTVWHSPHEFTLDFATTMPPERKDPEDEDSPVVVPARVTARVKIPVTMIFDVIRAINENMTRYEEAAGPIKRPGQEEEE